VPLLPAAMKVAADMKISVWAAGEGYRKTVGTTRRCYQLLI
jgi:hypothetical protein